MIPLRYKDDKNSNTSSGKEIYRGDNSREEVDSRFNPKREEAMVNDDDQTWSSITPWSNELFCFVDANAYETKR